MKLFKCLFAFVLLALQVTAQNKNEIQNMHWLVGSWQGMHKDKPFYEAWRKASDNVLVNFSIEIKGNDTLVKEEGAIVIKNDKVLLGKAPTQWILKRSMNNELVFENDSLKFSNRIIWLHTKNDHWFTILQHPKSTVYFDMVKVPALDVIVDRFIAQSRQKNKK